MYDFRSMCAIRANTEILRLAVLSLTTRSRGSVVGIGTDYGLDDQRVGVRVPVGSRIFSSPNRPDRLWSPLNLLSNGYRGLSPGGKADGA
jgi:hypothetical protein